jgi:molecular chaperone DnaK (HSP70)
MALWKPFRGNRTALDTVEKHDGYVYFCVDDGSLFFDYTDADGNLQRKQISAQEAEKITGDNIATILNSSDVEIPTSKIVMDAIEDAKTEALNSDVVVLAEAQKNIDAVSALVGDTSVSDQISTALDEATASDFGIYVQAQEPTNAVAGDIWIDTANDPTYIPPTIPEITEADNGKVLMVVNGQLQLVSLNLSIDANGVVSI